MRTFADWYWPVWIVILFGVPETIALLTHHPEATFSDWTWRAFDVVPGSTIWEWRITHLILLVVMLWLVGHLVFRLWR